MLVVALAIGLWSGCSANGSAKSGIGDWFGGSKSQAMYASTGGLAVYAEPKGTSRVVGRLAANEKVLRTQEKDGFAFVRARDGALEGWVADKKLRAKPFTKTGAPSPAGAAPNQAAQPGKVESAAEPESAEEATSADATATAVEPAAATSPAEVAPEPVPAQPAASEKPAPATTKKKVGASVLDPY